MLRCGRGKDGRLRAYSRRGGGASQSNLPGRPSRRRPVPACNLALRVVHDRVQPLGRRSLRGVHSGRLDRGHETHRPAGSSAVRVGPATGHALSPGSTTHRPRPAEKPFATKAGRGDRRQHPLPASCTERRSSGSTPLRISPPSRRRRHGTGISLGRTALLAVHDAFSNPPALVATTFTMVVLAPEDTEGWPPWQPLPSA
jgi:hypothetical protein